MKENKSIRVIRVIRGKNFLFARCGGSYGLAQFRGRGRRWLKLDLFNVAANFFAEYCIPGRNDDRYIAGRTCLAGKTDERFFIFRLVIAEDLHSPSLAKRRVGKFLLPP